MPEPVKPSIVADANLFFAVFAAGVVAQNGLSDNTLSSLQQGWILHKQAIEWVNDGGDVREFARQQSVAKKAAEKAAFVASEDARLEKERVARAAAEMGARAPVTA